MCPKWDEIRKVKKISAVIGSWIQLLKSDTFRYQGSRPWDLSLCQDRQFRKFPPPRASDENADDYADAIRKDCVTLAGGIDRTRILYRHRPVALGCISCSCMQRHYYITGQSALPDAYFLNNKLREPSKKKVSSFPLAPPSLILELLSVF